MQLNIFYTLHEKMQGMNIGYFDLTSDVEEAYERARGDVRERTEALTIVHFKSTAGRRPGSKLSKEKLAESRTGRPRRATESSDTSTPPPPYSAALSPGSPVVGRSHSTASASLAAAAKAKAAPPPPKPKPAWLSGPTAPVETVTALYDYEAQAEGDLSFISGEVIEVIKRTNNENEWWTGRVNGRSGQFPGRTDRRRCCVMCQC
jgi:amphiphysin